MGADWIKLAEALNMSAEDIEMVANEPITQAVGPDADRARCQHMLSLWQQRSAADGLPTDIAMGTHQFVHFLSAKIKRRSGL